MAINIRNSARDVDMASSASSGFRSLAPPRDLGRQAAASAAASASATTLLAPNQPDRPSRSTRSDVSIQVDVTGGRDKMGRSGNSGGSGANKKKSATSSSSSSVAKETPLYSREDICEQYVISKKALDGASSSRRSNKGFFGCLSSRKDAKKKSKRSSSGWFALCVRRASEENLYNGCNKPVVNANRSVTLPAIQPFAIPLRDEQQALFRNRPQSFCTSDPRRFSQPYPQTSAAPCIVNAPRRSETDWKFNTLPVQRTLSDATVDPEGAGAYSAGTSGAGARPFHYGGRLAYTQPNTPEMSVALYRRQIMSSEALMTDSEGRPVGPTRPTMLGNTSSSKHVSFDDGSSPSSPSSSEIYTAAVPANASKSTERLLDGLDIRGSRSGDNLVSSGFSVKSSSHHRHKKHHQQQPQQQQQQQQQASLSPVLARAILLERLRQASMRSQSTQTDQGCYNSTTSLSYPSCFSADSQSSIAVASGPMRTTQVQTGGHYAEPRRNSSNDQKESDILLRGCLRLTKSSSNLNEDDLDDRCGRHRCADLSSKESLGEEEETEAVSLPAKSTTSTSMGQVMTTTTSATSPKSRTSRRRQKQQMQQSLSKAVSEGTILLLDRKRARRFASGYVEVNVHHRSSSHGDDRCHSVEVEEEEILAGRVMVQDTPPESSSDDELLLDGRLLRQRVDEMADKKETYDGFGVGDGDDDDDDLPLPPPPAEAFCDFPVGDNPLQDEPKSFDSNASLPDTPPGNFSDEYGSTSLVTVLQPASGMGNESGDEPSEQPPTPPPRRTGGMASIITDMVVEERRDSEKEIMVEFPPWTPPSSNSDVQPTDVMMIPAPASFAADDDQVLAEPVFGRERIPLGRLRESTSKSMSETITSVDSEGSSGCGGENQQKVGTEHETSPSNSDPLSPVIPVHEPPPEGVHSPPEGDHSSDTAFLTALSDNLTASAAFNSAVDLKSDPIRAGGGGGGGSDTSHHSTLRMDQPITMDDDLPCDETPDQVPERPGSNSSTSGSYSLRDQGDLSSPPLARPPQGFSSSTSPAPVLEDDEDAITASVAAAAAVADRRAQMKEGLKLQFPSGATMFHNPPGTVPTPTRPTNGGRRGNNNSGTSRQVQLSSSDSEEEAAARMGNKRRPAKSRSKAQESTSRKRPDSSVGAEGLLTPGMVRSPAMHEGFRAEDWIPPVDDEIFRLQHASESSDAPAADPACATSAANVDMARWLAPSPSHKNNGDSSIRSVSPGSDNVFLSQSETPGNVKPPEGFADSPVRITAPEGKKSKRSCSSGRTKRTKSCTLPAGGSTHSLEASAGRGQEEDGPQRTVSAVDVMWYPETQLPPKRQLTVRAKSEERERWNRPARRNFANMAKSVEGHWEAAGVGCDGTPLDDEDAGIYNASYRAAAWAYIGETEELQVWRRSQPQTPLQEADDSSTASEKDFRRKYTSITHRMVHRKSSVEMFRRLATSTFEQKKGPDSSKSVRHSLENVYHLMLMIWCRESRALHQFGMAGECDDIVLVKRESGEFGFRIHGSRPVVVSAIEPGTPAELSGLQVGDIIIAINDVNVLDSSHSDVVRIAHAGSDELKLEVARTCHVLAVGGTGGQSDSCNHLAEEHDAEAQDGDNAAITGDGAIMTGYLWKKSQSASRGAAIMDGSIGDVTANVWYRRWFALKRDNCLYYYKNQDSSQPLGAVSLLHYTVTRSAFPDRPHGLLLSKGGTIRHWLAAETAELAERWHSVFNYASKAAVQDVWLEVCSENILLPPASIVSPDCVGHLMKLGHRAKEWQRRFCLLKDACLYFYVETNATSALGAIHLHGYRVQSSGTTASSGERRKFAFELLPPEPRMRHFHFYTDSENDRKRWIAALEYSIDRWIRVG